MYKKIVLPIDMSEPASWAKALPQALALCQSFGASLHIVSVLPDYRMPMVGAFFPQGFSEEARESLSKEQRGFVAEHVPDSVKVQCIITDGSPYEGIIKTTETINADLIVMASHNRRKLVDHVIGPNAEHVVRHAKIPVMVVR